MVPVREPADDDLKPRAVGDRARLWETSSHSIRFDGEPLRRDHNQASSSSMSCCSDAMAGSRSE
eukprot:2452229-Amphidinium_carterae.1